MLNTHRELAACAADMRDNLECLRSELGEANRNARPADERAKIIKAAMWSAAESAREMRKALDMTPNQMKEFITAWKALRGAYEQARDVTMWKCSKAARRMSGSATWARHAIERWLQAVHL